jgi:molecular chaperone DnaK (HSP70)
MIPKGTLLPAKANQSFALARSNMDAVKVRIVEGESTVAGECTPLGICEIALDRTLPKGTVVNVSYAYDDNQVLTIVVEAAGKQASAKIDRMCGISKDAFAEAEANLRRIQVS